MWKFFLLSVLFVVPLAYGQMNSIETGELSLSYSREYTRSTFYLGTEMMNIAGNRGASALGAGPKIGFEYALSEKYSLASNMSFAFQATGKPGALLYSGVNGFVKYNVSGSGLKYSELVRRADGSLIYSAKRATQKRLALLVGMDQLFLNGVASIYPAVGPSIGGSMSFSLMDIPSELEVRYSTLTANDNPLTMISLSGTFNLNF